MKNIFLLLILCSCLNLFGQTSQITRAIHIVYDDSSSMIRDDHEPKNYTHRWAYARYAMEVFTAMMETDDTMRIYYMSDFIHNRRANARIVMRGSESVRTRVEKVHNTTTLGELTPFDPVLKAFEDIKNQPVHQKWLIILTDGVFNRLEQSPIKIDSSWIEQKYKEFANEENMRIVHFAMGEKATTISPNYNRHIYDYHAKNDEDILRTITQVSNRIFNRNVLKFTNENRGTFKFDIPMHDLIVFAQGANVNINNISGTENRTPDDIVNVSYNQRISKEPIRLPRINDADVKRPENLSGIMATFLNLKKGSYKIDVSGSEEVEIYYKPDVRLVVKLYPTLRLFRSRKPVDKTNIEDLYAGKYKVKFGIVPNDGKKHNPTKFKSDFIKNPEFSFTYNGETFTKNGTVIQIKEGDFGIISNAIYSDINHLEDSIQGHAKKKSLLQIILEWWRSIIVLLIVVLICLVIYDWWRRKNIPAFPSNLDGKIEDNGVSCHGFAFEVDKPRKNKRFFVFNLKRYDPETATLVFIPKSLVRCPLKVVAQKNNSMMVANIGDFDEAKLPDKVISVRISEILSYNDSISSTIRVDGRDREIICKLEK